MRRIFLFALIIMMATGLQAQGLPDAILIQRIKANQPLYKEYGFGRNLREIASTQKRDVSDDMIVHSNVVRDFDGPKEDIVSSRFLKKTIGNSDLIIRGTITKNVAAMTADQSFVFTDSEVRVDEVLFCGDSPAIKLRTEITMTSPGGRLTLDGHHISTYLSNTAHAAVGHQYLLFLKYLPQSQSYKRIDFEGFDITGILVRPIRLDEVLPGSELFVDRERFLPAIRAAVLASGTRVPR